MYSFSLLGVLHILAWAKNACESVHVCLSCFPYRARQPTRSGGQCCTMGTPHCQIIELHSNGERSYCCNTLVQQNYLIALVHAWPTAIKYPDIKMKHCAYGHSVATLLNPCGVTTVSHRYSLTVARHTTVVVAVPSTVHYPANYKMKIYYFKWHLKL
jgi:hypothetical protein